MPLNPTISASDLRAPPARATDRLLGYDGLAFHALIILFIIATQFLYTPTRDLGPDNTWHYRFARDIVDGVPIYWAGLDGNRLFPDLLFALVAYVLSGRALFEGWLPFFYALFFLALYGSLVALAPTLYESVRERRTFVLLSVAALWAFELAAPFWPRWYFDPGNHGTGLPVAFLCLALAFRMNEKRRFDWGTAAIFVLAASLLVGSNRFLLIAFVIPLLVALVVLLAARGSAGRIAQRQAAFTLPRPGSAPLPALIGLVVLAAAGSYLGYRLLSTLSWHKGTTYMGVSLLNNMSLSWAVRKLGTELADIRTYFFQMTRQVAVGPALILATIPASLVLFVRAVRQGPPSAYEENRLVLGLMSAGSGALSIGFVIWGWNEGSEWRYRYLAMAVAFAAVFLASLPVRRAAALPGRAWLAAASLLVLLGLTFVPAFHREAYVRAERNEKFLRQVGELRHWLAAHTSKTPPRGFGEYWAVMDVSARTRLRIDLLDENQPRFKFYNNNAGSLCRGGYSFILRKMGPDQPKRSMIVAALGEPRVTREMEPEGHQQIEIMVYDPELIERLTEESKKEAARLFPGFSCPPARTARG